MPSMNDAKHQLLEWEQSHTTVMLSFSEYRQFYLHLFGKIGCEMHCGYFEFIREEPGGGRFSSPLLLAFKVVSLSPDFGNHATKRLRHRRRRWQMTLIDTGSVELTVSFIASRKPTRGQSYVQETS
jgi:hypothetical protein